MRPREISPHPRPAYSLIVDSYLVAGRANRVIEGPRKWPFLFRLQAAAERQMPHLRPAHAGTRDTLRILRQQLQDALEASGHRHARDEPIHEARKALKKCRDR